MSGIEKTDKRVVLPMEDYLWLISKSNVPILDDTWTDREKLGNAISYIVERFKFYENAFIDLDDKTKDRIDAMLKNGIFPDKNLAVSEAINDLFEVKRHEIMKKLETL